MCYNRCHGNVGRNIYECTVVTIAKGLRALWDNIYECFAITVVMVMLLWDLGPCGIIFMNVLL
jgi:hypothetical protein